VSDDNWRDAWVAALSELESDVARVEAVLADDHRARDLPIADPWTPPEGLGPLPLDLRPQADAILARQIAAAQAISTALGANRRQAAAAARIEDGRRSAPLRPVYVDHAL
jgi:hypothetical protein